MLGLEFMIIADASHDFIYDMDAYIFSQLPDLIDNGVSGLAYAVASMPNPIPRPGGPSEVAGVIGVTAVQDTSDPESLLKIWKPLNETINSRWPGAVQFITRTTPYDSYFDWVQGYFDNSTAGVDSYLGSRLLDKKALTGNLSALAKAIKLGVEIAGGFTALLVSGKGVHDGPVSGGPNSISPEWRKSYVLASKSTVSSTVRCSSGKLIHMRVRVVTGVGFQPLNATAKADAVDRMNETLEPLRQLAPDTGSYFNEVTIHSLSNTPSFAHPFAGIPLRAPLAA